MRVYTELETQEIIKNIKGWEYKSNGIERKFIFKSFAEALGFIIQIGFLAEKRNHHPELFNVCNTVKIRLTTHDASGVTDKDFDLAQAINKI